MSVPLTELGPLTSLSRRPSVSPPDPRGGGAGLGDLPTTGQKAWHSGELDGEKEPS